MNGTAMNGTAQLNRTGHLTLVSTPTAAELERMVRLGQADRRGPAALRLTRRGQLVVVALFLLALFGGGVLFGTGSKAGASDQAGAPHQYVVVQPGQTLWGIAKQIAPNEDPRAMIEAIRRLNALPDTGVQAGQRIALP
jgi:LysM repeat protein